MSSRVGEIIYPFGKPERVVSRELVSYRVNGDLIEYYVVATEPVKPDTPSSTEIPLTS